MALRNAKSLICNANRSFEGLLQEKIVDFDLYMKTHSIWLQELSGETQKSEYKKWTSWLCVGVLTSFSGKQLGLPATPSSTRTRESHLRRVPPSAFSCSTVRRAKNYRTRRKALQELDANKEPENEVEEAQGNSKDANRNQGRTCSLQVYEVLMLCRNDQQVPGWCFLSERECAQ